MILFNEGDTAGRRNALFRSADPGYPIPAVHSSYAVGEELYNLAKPGQHPTVNLATFGVDVETCIRTSSRRPRAVTRITWCSWGRTWTPCPPVLALTMTARARRSSSRSPRRSPRRTRPATRSGFLWFGGEEDGLVGSQYYAAHLSAGEVARTDMMLDTDMIASSNFARLVYDGDGSTFGSDVSGPAGSGKIEKVLRQYWADQGMASDPIPFDGRSDYVGFVNRGIPSGGVFAGAEAPKTAAQVAKYGGVQGRAAGPVLPRGLRHLRDAHRPAARATMNVYAQNPALAQQQSDSLNGNALRSLQQFKDNLVHAVWFFANASNAFPAKASVAKAKKVTRTYRFKYRGHRRVAR